MAGYILANLTSGGGGGGNTPQHFNDDVPLSFGATAVSPQFQIEYKTTGFVTPGAQLTGPLGLPFYFMDQANKDVDPIGVDISGFLTSPILIWTSGSLTAKNENFIAGFGVGDNPYDFNTIFADADGLNPGSGGAGPFPENRDGVSQGMNTGSGGSLGGDGGSFNYRSGNSWRGTGGNINFLAGNGVNGGNFNLSVGQANQIAGSNPSQIVITSYTGTTPQNNATLVQTNGIGGWSATIQQINLADPSYIICFVQDTLGDLDNTVSITGTNPDSTTFDFTPVVVYGTPGFITNSNGGNFPFLLGATSYLSIYASDNNTHLDLGYSLIEGHFNFNLNGLGTYNFKSNDTYGSFLISQYSVDNSTQPQPILALIREGAINNLTGLNTNDSYQDFLIQASDVQLGGLDGTNPLYIANIQGHFFSATSTATTDKIATLYLGVCGLGSNLSVTNGIWSLWAAGSLGTLGAGQFGTSIAIGTGVTNNAAITTGSSGGQISLLVPDGAGAIIGYNGMSIADAARTRFSLVTAWSDNVDSNIYQSGNISNNNLIIAGGFYGSTSTLDRTQISTNSLQIINDTYNNTEDPQGLFEVDNNIDNLTASVIRGSTSQTSPLSIWQNRSKVTQAIVSPLGKISSSNRMLGSAETASLLSGSDIIASQSSDGGGNETDGGSAYWFNGLYDIGNHSAKTINAGYSGLITLDGTSGSMNFGVAASASADTNVSINPVMSLTQDGITQVHGSADLQAAQYWHNTNINSSTTTSSALDPSWTFINSFRSGSGTQDIALPQASVSMNRMFILTDGSSNADTNALTITPFSGDAINGSTLPYPITNANGSVLLICSGSGWNIVASNLPQPIGLTQGGTGANTQSGARTALGLGTIATQDANAVNITGGTITGIGGLLPGLKIVTATVDLTVANSNIPLYQPSAGKNFSPLLIWADNVSINGLISPSATVSIGSFGSSYTDWAPLAALAFNSLAEYKNYYQTSAVTSTITNSNFLGVHVGTASTVSGGGFLTCSFHVVGFEQ